MEGSPQDSSGTLLALSSVDVYTPEEPSSELIRTLFANEEAPLVRKEKLYFKEPMNHP